MGLFESRPLTLWERWVAYPLFALRFRIECRLRGAR